ncbi:hypothetical protein U1Q18_031531 [Sarracenia purpurea var. burkii]
MMNGGRHRRLRVRRTLLLLLWLVHKKGAGVSAEMMGAETLTFSAFYTDLNVLVISPVQLYGAGYSYGDPEFEWYGCWMLIRRIRGSNTDLNIRDMSVI